MRISIVLANYNHGAYLAQNLDGVRAQTHADWEMIVVDDASQDNSRTIIERYAAHEPRIKLIFHQKNRGTNAAMRTGWEHITGSLVCGSAADDFISNPRFFEMAVEAMRTHPSAAGFAARATVIDAETGEELWVMGHYPAPGFLSAEEAAKAFWGASLFIPGASALWKRELVQGVGGYHDELGPQSDYFVNHALAALGGVVLAEEPVVAVRASSSSFSAAVTDADYFRRHALAEKKMRALDVPYRIAPEWIKPWRERIIAHRSFAGLQERFTKWVRGYIESIQPWERRALPPGFLAYLARLSEDIAPFEADIRAQRAAAWEIFDKVAGKLD
ncbi:MAG TPA: glycosyltransferase family 2 protein [Casimicrobiaceae bacterium]|nr:glycosyltransferase family 2 protein [Casimicrobiaceae bacterium]